MAGNELKTYKIFQIILNIFLQMLNWFSSLKNNFKSEFSVRDGGQGFNDGEA